MDASFIILGSLGGLVAMVVGYWVWADKRRSTTYRRFGGPCACTQDDHCSCCVYFTEYSPEFPDVDTMMGQAFKGSWDEIHSVGLRSEWKESLHYAFKTGWLERGKQAT